MQVSLQGRHGSGVEQIEYLIFFMPFLARGAFFGEEAGGSSRMPCSVLEYPPESRWDQFFLLHCV